MIIEFNVIPDLNVFRTDTLSLGGCEWVELV
jgi:hypothetical protein